MKKVLSALIAAAMLLSMTACDGGNGAADKDPTDPDYFCLEATGQYSDGIMLPELANAQVSVMMSIDWNYLEKNNDESDPFAQYQATLIWRDVYADQDGDVTITTISDEQQTDYLATQTASGTAPDIIPTNYDLTYPKWDAAGLTASIEDYADYLQLDAMDPTDPERTLYNRELMKQAFQWGGESHGAVTLDKANKQYIVYNKTKFEQAGQKNPLELWQEGKWNWTQFVKTAKAMTGNDDFGFTGWGLFPYFAPYPMAIANDDGTLSLGIYTDAEDEEVKANATKYMRYMTEVYNLYQVSHAARNTGDELQKWGDLFPAGTDAMVMTDLSGYKRIFDKAKKMDGDTFGIAPVPVFDPNGETQSIAAASCWAYGISSAAENPIGACAYIRLETLVSRNISAALKGTTWTDLNLTDEEKDMIEATKDDPIVLELIRGVGECYLGIIDARIVPAYYYKDTQESVQAIFDAEKNALEAEFDEFNQMALETAAEAEAEKEAAEEAAAAAE